METYSQHEEEKKDERTAMIITFVTAIVLALLLFFLTAFSQPDPLPEIPEVVMFEFGGSAGGGSNNDASSSSSSASEQVTPQPTADANPVDVESVTENTTEVPVEAAPSSGDKPTKKPPREVNSNTLFPGDNGNGNNDGGGGGDGTSDGGGSGTSTGPGSGDFGDGDFNLSERGVLQKPSLNGDFPEVGDVVVDIYVDRLGNVFKARVNRLRTDITDEDQIAKAVAAAKKAKFTVKQDAAVEQKGSITFHFNKN